MHDFLVHLDSSSSNLSFQTQLTKRNYCDFLVLKQKQRPFIFDQSKIEMVKFNQIVPITYR